MAPFDAPASGFPGATQLSLAILSGTAFEEEAFCLEDILPYDPAYDAELVPEDWFGADGDSVAAYHDWLERTFFGSDELGETLEALETLHELEHARDQDPHHPWHEGVRHCLNGELFVRVVLAGADALWRMSVLFSPEDEAVRAIRWHVARSRGQCYARKGSDFYLHVFVMRRMLWDDATLRKEMCDKFGVIPSLANHPHTAIEDDVERLMTAGIVHHRNHDTADCRRENLELVTPIDNTRQAQQKPGASGYVGVRRRSVNDHWQFEALVVRRGRKRKWSRRLGCYPTAFLAAVARALFLIGHPRWLAVSYTPTKRDEQPWKMAKALAADETVTDLGVLELLANHKKFRRLLRFARLQVSKGRAVQVRGRDGGH